MTAASFARQDTLPAPPLPARLSRAAQGFVQRALGSRPFWVGVAILVLACAARLVLITTSRFTGDEIVFWQAASGIAKGTDFPLLGPSITGGGARHPGPLFYYVMALPLFVSKAPEACNAFVAILGGFSVLLYWSALRPFFGEIGATFAAALMACAPWSTLYGDRIWNPNVIVFFVALSFWAACRMRTKPSLGTLVLLVMSAAAMPQFHMSSPMVWLALTPIFLPTWRRWRWYWPLVAVGCAVLLYIPMLIHELRTHWENARLFLAETGSNTSDDWKRVPAWAFRLLTLDISYHQLHSYWGQHTEKEMLEFLESGNSDFVWTPLRRAALILSGLFAMGALAFWVVRTAMGGRSKPARPFLWAAIVGLAANTALLGLTHKAVYGHYVESLLPFYFVAFAELGRSAITWTRGWWVVYGAAALVCIGGIDSALWVSNELDARNGLTTMRRVIAAVEKDRPGIHSANLSFGYRGWNWGFNVIADLDHEPLSFGGGPGYRLMLRGNAAPNGARLVMETGPVALYTWK